MQFLCDFKTASINIIIAPSYAASVLKCHCIALELFPENPIYLKLKIKPISDQKKSDTIMNKPGLAKAFIYTAASLTN